MPRDISGSELDLLQTSDFETYGRLFIDGTLVEDVNGYDPLISASWGVDLDELVWNATFRLHLGLDEETNSPLMSTAASLNYPGTVEPRKLFETGRQIQLQTACVASGGAPGAGDWHTVFDGLIDDYDPAGEGDEDVLVITARDLYSVVLDFWTETFRTADTDMPLGDFLHALFDNTDFGGLVAGIDLFLQIVGDPAFTIKANTYDPQSLLLLMREAALANGWDLRGRFGTPPYAPNQFILTHYDPNRAATTPQWEFGPDNYYGIRSLKVSRNTVRNHIKVTPNDTTRNAQTVLDLPSSLLYRWKFMELSELGTGSYVTDDTEALNLANFVLSDLKDPKATKEVIRGYFWPLELNDLCRFQPNGIHYDQVLTVAASGITHNLLEGGDAETIIQTRGTPAAANSHWRYNPKKTLYLKDTTPSGDAPTGALWAKLAPVG